MPTSYNILMGTPSRTEKIPKYEPYQEEIFQKLAGSIPQQALDALQAGQAPTPPYQGPPQYTPPEQYSPQTAAMPVRGVGPLPSADFGPIAEREMHRFKTDILPTIKSQFAGGGGMRSGGYLEALDRGGQGLATNLAALGSQHALGQQQAGLQYMGLGLQQQGLEQRSNLAQRQLEQQGGQFTQDLGQRGQQFGQQLGQQGSQYQQQIEQRRQGMQLDMLRSLLDKVLSPQQDIGYFQGKEGLLETGAQGLAQGLAKNANVESLGDWLGPVGTGATTGATLGAAAGGPAGSLIGAGVGGLAGLIPKFIEYLRGKKQKQGQPKQAPGSVVYRPNVAAEGRF